MWRNETTCPKSHGWEVAKVEFGAGQVAHLTSAIQREPKACPRSPGGGAADQRLLGWRADAVVYGKLSSSLLIRWSMAHGTEVHPLSGMQG